MARSPSGVPCLFSGWLDNRDELRGGLAGCNGDAVGPTDAHLYAAAFEMWGDSVDVRAIGTYAAIIAPSGEPVRLSRSPWNGMPLFYAFDSSGIAVASVPRPIFAAGWPQTLRDGAIERLLAFQVDRDDATPFAGVDRVPSGCIVRLGQGGATVDRWYDPLALEPTVLGSDEAYLDRANALLREAAKAALANARRPALQLSGGLDSAIVADEMLRCLPQPARLRSYTFHPLDEASPVAPPTLYPDERPLVDAFLAQHPRIDASFVDNRETTFDDRSRALFLAGGTAFPGMALTSAHHGCFEAAARDGCDWLFNANLGNITISNDAPWAWPELFARGHWRALWRLLRDRPGDGRSMPRRMIAHGLMPHLPRSLGDWLRRRIHGDEHERFGNSLLRHDGPASDHVSADPADGIATAGAIVRSRAEWLEQTYRHCGGAAELGLAYAQVFGIGLRDVTQYRPLIEFCVTIPTDQLARHGLRRFLARRMAQGRMPEAQRLNPRLGMHMADWHFRMAGDLARLRRQVESLAEHPVLGPSIDIDKARALLATFPDAPPDDPTAGAAWRFDLPAALLIADYVDFITGRNAG